MFDDEPNKERYTLMQPGGGGGGKSRGTLKLLLLVAAAGLALAYGYRLWTRREPAPPVSTAAPEQPASKQVAGSVARPVVKPVVIPAGEELNAINECLAFIEKNDYRSARQKAFEILNSSQNQDAIRKTEELLSQINVELVTSPRQMEEKQDYTVKSGDTLDKISKQFGTTIELIQKSNNIRGSIIRPGDKLRVFSVKLTIHVSKTDNDLLLLANDRFFKRYKVGTGKHGTTPVGTFRVNDKIKNPPWWTEGRVVPFGDKENVLGTRWLSIAATGDTEPFSGYGIHGTWEDETIGSQSSAGCIRLLNKDVEELFMIVPVGTDVIIRE